MFLNRWKTIEKSYFNNSNFSNSDFLFFFFFNLDGWPHDVHGSRLMAISHNDIGRRHYGIGRFGPARSLFQWNAREYCRHYSTMDVYWPIVSSWIQFPHLRITIHRHHFVSGALNFFFLLFFSQIIFRLSVWFLRFNCTTQQIYSTE